MRPAPLPDTALTLSSDLAGCVTLRFRAATTGRRWFLWRLDDGPWSAPQERDHTELLFLPGGLHHVEAAVLDHRLRRDPTPARAVFRVRIDPDRQVAAVLARLRSGSHAEREATVAALARQPAARPALLAARRAADADARWWIDAALQEIAASERRQRRERGADAPILPASGIRKTRGAPPNP